MCRYVSFVGVDVSYRCGGFNVSLFRFYLVDCINCFFASMCRCYMSLFNLLRFVLLCVWKQMSNPPTHETNKDTET